MKYLVDFNVIDYYSVEVEADNPEKAKKMVLDRYYVGAIDASDCQQENFGEFAGVYDKEELDMFLANPELVKEV